MLYIMLIKIILLIIILHEEKIKLFIISDPWKSVLKTNKNPSDSDE